MTDGIIQKVIVDFLIKVNQIDSINADEIIDLQEELIKEIDIAFKPIISTLTASNTKSDLYALAHIYAIRNKILGETKE